MEEKKEAINPKIREEMERMKVGSRLSKLILAVFLIVALIFRFYFQIPLSSYLFIIISLWILSVFLKEFLVLKFIKEAKKFTDFQLLFSFLELFLLTLIIHFLGGVTWIGGVLYLMIISRMAIVLPYQKTKYILFGATALFLSLVLLEYLGVIPHHYVIPQLEGMDLHRDLPYVLATSFIMIAAIFYSFRSILFFSSNLKEKEKSLLKAQEDTDKALRRAEEAKNILEIRVKARTKELKELNEELEERVEKRTKEMQRRMEELEKFHRITVGREKRMIELKKENEKLKKEIEELKN